MTEATERAQLAVAGIVAGEPVREVNAERVRLTERIEDAEKREAWWSKAAGRRQAEPSAPRVRWVAPLGWRRWVAPLRGRCAYVRLLAAGRRA